MRKILIDSDVLMDFLSHRQPFFTDAVKILTRCEQQKFHGFVTPIIISNIYYLLRQVEKHEIVIEKLKTLMNFLDIVIVDKKIIIHSLNSDFPDFEDVLQNYAAEQSHKIDVIITRNIKDYKHSSLNVLTPTEFLNIF